MNKTFRLKNVLLIALLSLICVPSAARRWHRAYWHFRPAVTVVTRPVVTAHISNRFSQKERLAMALAYLGSHPSISVKQYAKITSLSKEAAEAELDAFVLDKKNQLGVAVSGKNKVYVRVQ